MKKALTNFGMHTSRFYILLVILFASTLITMDLQAQVVAYRVNAGGRVADAGDNSFPEWSADEQLADEPAPIQFARNGTPSPYVNEDVAGDQTAGRNQEINLTGIIEPGGISEILFATQRWDVNPPEQNLIYSFPVTTGRIYQVNLYFTELFGEGQGTRQFDIIIEGELVQNNLDILSITNNVEKIGITTQYELTAGDDMLDVEFFNETSLPAVISAIEIVDLSSTNQAPVAVVPDRQSSLEEETVSLALDVTDDSETLFYEAEGLPSGLSIDAATGVISGTIDAGVQGVFDVTITVFDDGNPPAGTIFTFQWSVANDPTVANPIADVTAEIGDEELSISLTDVFDDPGESSLTYTLTGNTDPSVVAASISGQGDAIVLNFDNSTAGTSDITVRATNQDGGFGEDTFTVEVLDLAVPSAVFQVTPNSTLGGSTFNASSLLLENTSAGNITIVSITIDLTNSLFPDMVYDPTGAAGDSGAKCLTPDLNAEETGYVIPENACIDPFDLPLDGGFLEMTVNFNDFDPGEVFGFSVDADPTSIKGNPNVGDAGSVGGIELIGSEVTVEFSNGQTITNDLFYLAESAGGAQAVLQNRSEVVLATPAIAPTIGFLGEVDTEVDFTEVAQDIVVGGSPNSNVTLFQVDGRLNLIGTPNGGFDIDPFEANEAIGVIETYSATLDNAGTATISVNLKRSFFDGSFSGGLNHFIAVVEDEFSGRTSNRLIGNLQAVSTTSFADGWNLIGLSVEVEDNNYLSLYAGVAPELAPFGWDGSGYVQIEDLDNGAAYWLDAANAGEVGVFGTEIITLSVALTEGWNMIAGPSCAVDILDIEDPSSVIVAGTIFEYDEGYFSATSVVPNKGYWVNASGDGTITFDCSVEAPAKHSVVTDDKASFGTLVLSDQSGSDQVLYFGGQLEGDARNVSYLLPPYGPNGFDARFNDGTHLVETEKAIISLRSDAFPVELTMDDAPEKYLGTYTVEAIAGDKVVGTYSLAEGERVSITNSDVTALIVSTLAADIDAVPDQFSLDGNYPNPFNPTTNIVFNLPENATMQVEVFDLLGRQVMVLGGLEMQAGAGRQIQLDASSLASGSYIYRIHATMDSGNMTQTGRMTLLK